MITNLKIGYNGRFGNQLFQFASLLGISKKTGLEFRIPKSNTNPIVQKTMDGIFFNSKFELHECFELDQNIFEDIRFIRQNRQESHFHFDETIFDIQDFTNIDGYFQTHKYFDHCENDLLDILKFRPEITKTASSLLPVTDKDLVCVHIRRGDYTYPNPYHPVVSDEYLDKSILSFDRDTHHFVIFSDDINWCMEKWKNTDFSFFKSESNFVDFCAMSLCQHHIISNSSFSWWSSYLSKNKDKRVFAPKRWFGEGYSNYITSDIYRNDMIVF